MTGRRALDYLAGAEYDAVILDIMMPVLDGPGRSAPDPFGRSREPGAPRAPSHRPGQHRRPVAGLDAGANDYLVKPFAVEELLARVRVLLRRPEAAGEGTCLQAGDLRLCTDTHEVTRSGQADPPLWERVCAAPLHDAESGHRAYQGQAGAAHLELRFLRAVPT